MRVEYDIVIERGPRGRRQLGDPAAPAERRVRTRPPTVHEGRVPRVARLLALGLHFEELVRVGAVRDYAELARMGHVSRARMVQIMNLCNLAPDIIEAILDLPLVTSGRDKLGERDLRPITALAGWAEQRAAWQRCRLR